MYYTVYPIPLLLICLITFAEVKSQDSLEIKTFKYADGTISSEGLFSDGLPEGYWKTYYPTSQLKSEGNRKNHALDGMWIFYEDNGDIQEKISYVSGKKNGVVESYVDGKLFSACDYANDVKKGTCYYYTQGYIEKEIPFIADKEDGRGYAFDKKGILVAYLFYKDGFLRRSERMNATDKLGRKQGMWRTFFEDKSVKTEGNYLDDQINGLFKEYNTQGDIILLEKYENDILITDAAETIVVDIRNDYFSNGRVSGSGAYKKGNKHGVHRRYDEQGNVIDAVLYDEGKEVGRGIIGVSGKIEGPWKLYYPNGNIKEEGEYKEGQRDGNWQFYDQSGKLIQKGNFRKGKPDGLWRWFHDYGTIRREESYTRGREDGESVEYDKEGKIISQGSFTDGLKDGAWQYHIGDHTVKGSYLQGEKDGKWIGVYDNGKTQFRGSFIQGFAIGKHKFYYSSGQLKQDGKYSSGRKDGEWKMIDEDGELILRIAYEQGIERRLEGVRIVPTFEELGID